MQPWRAQWLGNCCLQFKSYSLVKAQGFGFHLPQSVAWGQYPMCPIVPERPPRPAQGPAVSYRLGAPPCYRSELVSDPRGPLLFYSEGSRPQRGLGAFKDPSLRVR